MNPNHNPWGNGAPHKRKNRWEENEDSGKRARPSDPFFSNQNQRRGSLSDERSGGRFGARDNRPGSSQDEINSRFNDTSSRGHNGIYGNDASSFGHAGNDSSRFGNAGNDPSRFGNGGNDASSFGNHGNDTSRFGRGGNGPSFGRGGSAANASRSLGGQYNNDQTSGRQYSDSQSFRGHNDTNISESQPFRGHSDSSIDTSISDGLTLEAGLMQMQHENQNFGKASRTQMFAKQDEENRRNVPQSPKSLMNVEDYGERRSGDQGARVGAAPNYDGRNQSLDGRIQSLMEPNFDGRNQNMAGGPQNLMGANSDGRNQTTTGGLQPLMGANFDGRNQTTAGGLQPRMGMNFGETKSKETDKGRQPDRFADPGLLPVPVPSRSPSVTKENTVGSSHAQSNSRFGGNDTNSLGHTGSYVNDPSIGFGNHGNDARSFGHAGNDPSSFGNDPSRFGHGGNDASNLENHGNDNSRFGRGGNGLSFGRGGSTSRFGHDGNDPSMISYGRGEEDRKGMGNRSSFERDGEITRQPNGNVSGNFGNGQGRDRIGSEGDTRSSDFGRQSSSGPETSLGRQQNLDSRGSRSSQSTIDSINLLPPPCRASSRDGRDSARSSSSLGGRDSAPRAASLSEITGQSSGDRFPSSADRNIRGFSQETDSEQIVTLNKMCEKDNIKPYVFYTHSIAYDSNGKKIEKIAGFYHVEKDYVPVYVYSRDKAETRAATDAIKRLNESKESSKEMEKLRLENSESLSQIKTLLTKIENLKTEHKKNQTDNQSEIKDLQSEKLKLESENKKLLSENTKLQSDKQNFVSENENLRASNKKLHNKNGDLEKDIRKFKDNPNSADQALHAEMKSLVLKNKTVEAANKTLADEKKKMKEMLTERNKSIGKINKELKDQKGTISKLESQKHDFESQISRLKSNHFETMDNNTKILPNSNGRMKIPKMNECTKESCQVMRRDLKKKSTDLKEMEDEKSRISDVTRKQEDEIKNLKEAHKKLEDENNQVIAIQEEDLKNRKKEYKTLEDANKKLDSERYYKIEKETLKTHFDISEVPKIYLKIEVEDKNIKIANCEKEKSQFIERLSSLELELKKSNGISGPCNEINELTMSIEQCDKTKSQFLLERTKKLADLEKLKKKIPKLQKRHQDVFQDFNTLSKKYDSLMQLRGVSSSAELENAVKKMFKKYNSLKDELKLKDS